jgi:hypothetical protein
MARVPFALLALPELKPQTKSIPQSHWLYGVLSLKSVNGGEFPGAGKTSVKTLGAFSRDRLCYRLSLLLKTWAREE